MEYLLEIVTFNKEQIYTKHPGHMIEKHLYAPYDDRAREAADGIVSEHRKDAYVVRASLWERGQCLKRWNY